MGLQNRAPASDISSARGGSVPTSSRSPPRKSLAARRIRLAAKHAVPPAPIASRSGGNGRGAKGRLSILRGDSQLAEHTPHASGQRDRAPRNGAPFCQEAVRQSPLNPPSPTFLGGAPIIAA